MPRKSKYVVPNQRARRLIVATTGLRAGLPAGEAMAQAVEEIVSQVAVEAGVFAGHAGRKTINPEDIALAAKNVLRK